MRPADRATVVRFKASDGTRLAGVMLGKGPVGIVLAHQLRANFCDWLPFARVLKADGYRVLAFDFRNSGSSAARAGLAGDRRDRDVAAAAAVLRRAGSPRTILMGASVGATASLVAAAAVTPPVAGVVSLSGPADFGVDAGRAVSGLTMPLLFVAAQDDDPFDDEARSLFEAAGSSDKKLELVSGAEHGTGLLLGSGGSPVRELLRRFVREYGRQRSGS